MSLFMQLRTFFLFIITLFAFPALAQPSSGLSCGIYTSDRGFEIHVMNTQLLHKVYKNDRITSHYVLNGNKVDMVSMESLMTSDFDISPDHKTLKDFSGEYVLTETKECSENVKKPESEVGQQCWNNMSECSALVQKSDVDALKKLCRDNIYAACDRWDSVAFSGDRIKKALAATTNLDLPMPSDPEWVATLSESCRIGLSGKMCNEAANALWYSGQYLAARDALQRACDALEWNNKGCPKAEALQSLTESDISSPTSGLPVGHYVTRSGGAELFIAQDGTVKMKGNASVKAQLDNGLVRIPRGQKDDFVFRRAGENKLIGIDSENTFKVYELQK
ncbi:hypothetical protein [Pectobacterium punjabense]|uniref:hypothetical protein n=1 Tax=Pectobacterium punjabense TaxID=2108399 RepID=UPI001968D928|nr:hypothetical protein [Pectobacterium punjabense]MBN3135438.1 hypothetical protein [Pectobacterium punjabense]MCE5382567.1 hypothetical protein [Pectobacterium punjabense]